MGLYSNSDSRIRREASAWVAKLGGNPNEDDRAAFIRWREADPRHAQAYSRMAGIWDQAAELSPSLAGAGDAWAQSPPRPYPRFAMAASLAALMFLACAVLLGQRWITGNEHRTIYYAAAIGEIKRTELPDGSKIILDSGSRVEADFTEDERKLTLKEGRARFEVARERRPFVVRAETSEVVATGTVFDVSLIEGRPAVFLLEGSLEVRPAADAPGQAGKWERLAPGQKLIVRARIAPERRTGTRGDTNWPSLMLEFDDVPLDEVVALANRYSKVQLKLGNERIGKLRLTGAYRAGDVEGLGQSLAAAFNLRVFLQPDGHMLLVDAAPV